MEEKIRAVNGIQTSLVLGLIGSFPNRIMNL